MRKPLDLSTVAEAVAWLSEATGQQWCESTLFNNVVNRGHTIRAVPPHDAEPVRVRFVPGEPDLVPVGKGLWGPAIVSNFSAAQVWLCGESVASAAATPSPFNAEGEYEMFNPPVRVTRDNVRFPGWVLDDLRQKCCVTAGDRGAQVDASMAPDKWANGLKRIAWEVAWRIIRTDGCRLTGKALHAGMADRQNEVKQAESGLLTYSGAGASLVGGEYSISRSSVEKDWRAQLEKLIKTR